MTVLVTGAGGQVGAEVLHRLSRMGRPVRAAGSSGSPAHLPAGVPYVRLDLSAPAAADEALADVDEVFLYARPEGVDGFLAAARAARVRHVVLLSTLAVPDDGTEPGVIGRRHLVVEQAVRSCGIDWTILRPGAFASDAKKQWATQIRTEHRLDLPYPESYSEPVHPDDIAEIAVRALGDERQAGMVHRITGPQSLTARAQVEAIASVIGATVELRQVERQEYAEQLAAHMPMPFVEAMLDYQSRCDGRPGQVHDTTALLARPPKTFAEWAAENSAAFVSGDRSPVG